MVKNIKTSLAIAGSDASGGAGIQADIKTMTMHGVYAMSVITALTAQNTLGVSAVSEVSPAFVKEQIDAVCEDIYPDSVKIGMVASEAIVEVIVDRLIYHGVSNIVVDPVMVATSGAALLKVGAVKALTTKLFPMATLVTPNVFEAEVLSDMKILCAEDMQRAASYISKTYGCNVLLKGGHKTEDANDLLYENGSFTWINGARLDNPNTHGTGCTLSSAIAANLAKGYSLLEAVREAKAYVFAALAAGLALGHGAGPLLHNFALHQEQ